MKTDIELRTGNWLLVVGPRIICPPMLMMTANLAEAGPVRVVDDGNHYNGYPVARAARGRQEVLERIPLISGAYNSLGLFFSCYIFISF